VNPAGGNKNPVTLVRIVVTRNSAVHPSTRFEPNIPHNTTIPEKIPIRLMTTCMVVNAEIDMPRIMTGVLSSYR
jgi:hypothetical protein